MSVSYAHLYSGRKRGKSEENRAKKCCRQEDLSIHHGTMGVEPLEKILLL